MNNELVKEYTPSVEKLFLDFLYTDTELFVRVKSIISFEYFDDKKIKEAVRFLIQHSNEYNSLPTKQQMKNICGVEIEEIAGVDDTHKNWFLNEFEEFCRHKALEIEIINSAALLKEKRYGEVEARIKHAVQIGLVKDLGLDYFKDPASRLEQLLEKDNMVPTGWDVIDKKLYGGTEKGTLNIFCGQSGAGKSLFLQNWALNHVKQGLNVVYITLELSEVLCSLRLDSMITGLGTKGLVKKIKDVQNKVVMFKKKSKGSLQIKQMPNRSTANDIHAYIREYELEKGIKVDSIMVDYLDLLKPYSVNVNASDMFNKDKYVSEELRNLAVELDVVVGTASQLNRTSFEDIDFNHSHIAGGISKIMTADNVMAIFSTPSMKEAGTYQVQFLKTRSSSGVGSKVELNFDVNSLRITSSEGKNSDVGSQDSRTSALTQSIMDKNQTSSNSTVTVTPSCISDKSTSSVNDVLEQNTILRDLLRKNT